MLKYKFGYDVPYDVLYMDPNQYITQIEDAYHHWFKDQPNTKVKSLIDPGNHPMLDMSLSLDEDDTQVYQSLIATI